MPTTMATTATATEINVNEMTFGVEIETVVPSSLRLCVGGYHHGYEIPELGLSGWNAQSDSSIHTPSDYRAVEIVSPILKGADGLQQIMKVCEWLNSVGAKVNRSTGLHVHVGWSGDENSLKRLVHYVANFEKAIFASTGTKSREEGSYCKGVRENSTYTKKYRDGQETIHGPGRYHVLNLTNLGEYRKNTVEFRAFAGTTNATNIIAYVLMCLAIVEKALRTKRAPKWGGVNPIEGSPCHRKGGEGQTQLARLFYGIGWTKGDTSHVFGKIEADGVPTIADCKAKLMELAAKYDSRRETPMDD